MVTNGGAFRVFSDGASRGNPGPSGAGYLIYDAKGNILLKEAVYLGDSVTNNVAEYCALIFALEKASVLTQGPIVCFSDSEVMVRQLSGEYNVRNPRLRPLYQRAIRLAGRFSSFAINHVRRELNAEADCLSRKAIDQHTNGKSSSVQIEVLDPAEGEMKCSEVLAEAIRLIRKGSKKVLLVGPEGEEITAYRAGDVLRIDIKEGA